MSTKSSNANSDLTAVWIAIAVVLATIVALAAGVLAWLAGDVLAKSVLIGFGGFGGTLTLALLVLSAFQRR